MSDPVPGREDAELTLRQRIRYRFDNLLARGTSATLIWLGIVTLIVVAISGLVLFLFGVGLSGSQDASYFEEFWQSMLRVIDPGTMAGDVGWGRRLLALAITVFGLLVAGTLIGVIAAGVEGRIENMRRGRSVVVESGHVVVLGASDRLPLMVRQLVIARAHLTNSVIVVLAEDDALEIQDAVRQVMPDRSSSRLVFRSGDPTRRSDLALTRLGSAEKVIILSDDGPGDDRALRTVVAVHAELGEVTCPIVVELEGVENAAHLVRVYGREIHPLVTAQAVARIGALALRQPGLGAVAVALFDDRGSDVHVCDVPGIDGKGYAEVASRVTDARVIGLMRRDGSPSLNPAPDTVIESGDRLVAIGDTPDLTLQELSEDGRSSGPHLDDQPEDQRLLVLGWSPIGSLMLTDWARAASSSSSAEVMLEGDPAIAVDFSPAGGPEIIITPDADLPDVERRLPDVDTVVILASVGTRHNEPDTRTLLLAAALRRLIDASDDLRVRLMVELSSVENIPLVTTRADDFVVSEAIGTQLLAQLAEQPERRPVLLDLYDPTTPSLRLVPVASLGIRGRTRASEIYSAGRSSGVTAIGWRLAPERGGVLAINAAPGVEVDLEPGDQIVVIG